MMKKSTKVFLILSLLLLATDLCFIAINYYHAHCQFNASMEEQSTQQRFAYQLALDMEFSKMLEMAHFFAADPAVGELFLQGKQAVLREGGGAGGTEANKIRQQLLNLVKARWTHMHQYSGIRQLHFHLGPGSLSFLRVHKPDKFGDRMDDLRHIIVDTNRDKQPRTGFEIGRIYSGLRGVMPVFVQNPDSGEQVHVGAVEVGAAFDLMFKLIDRQLKGGVAALLNEQYYQHKMWPDQIKATFKVFNEHCKCAVDSSSRPQIVDLLEKYDDLPPFGQQPFLQTFTQVDGRQLVVTHLPLFDYLGKRNQQANPVGRILLWRDISREHALLEKSIRASIAYAIFGYLLVELLLFWAMRLTTQHEVAKQTQTLRQEHQQLMQLKEQAETANRAKNTFLTNISHELRTPLNVILGYVQVLLQGNRLDQSQRQNIAAIQHSGQNLLTLINDMLDLTKIEAEQLKLTLQPCELNRFFAELSERFAVSAKKKGIAFHYQSTGKLPKVVNVDEKRLFQICMNLLSNALKFTDRGEIRLETDYTGGELLIRVSDTGIGIPDTLHQKIFNAFHQVGEDQYKLQGTGLGLAISSYLVKQMEGKIELKSKEGLGSCFSVHIPMSNKESPVSSESFDSVTQAMRITGYQRVDGQSVPLQVLVLDDHRDHCSVLDSLLESLGFVITKTINVAETISLTKIQEFDAIFIDLEVSGMNGLDAARTILTHPGDKNHLIITVNARVSEESQNESLSVGCQAHLGKPINKDELLNVLQQFLPLKWQYDQQNKSSSPETVSFSTEWLDTLQRAVILGNTQKTQTLLAEVTQQNAELGATLTSWLECYEYQKILDWIETMKN